MSSPGAKPEKPKMAPWLRLVIAAPLFGLIYWGLTGGPDMRPWLLILGWFAIIGIGGALSPAGRAAAAQRREVAATANVAAFSSGSPVVVRSYPGRSQVEATNGFAQEAAYAASKGYTPVAQSWGEGRPGAARILALGLYANVARPRGTLTVTYSLQTDPAKRS